MPTVRIEASSRSAGMRTAQRLAAVLLGTVLAAGASTAAAHKASDAYLRLSVTGHTVEQRLDIALRDLDRELALDADDDARLSWGEVRTRWGEIEALAARHVRIAADGRACTAQPAGAEAARAALDEHSDGAHAVLRSRWLCPAAVGTLEVGYDLFADTDAQHRGIVSVLRSAPPGNRARANAADAAEPGPPGADTATAQTAVLGPDQPQARFEPAGAASAHAPTGDWARFATFVAEGVHHILIGADHILFLLTLLLPAVMVQAATAALPVGRVGSWQGATRLRPVLAEVLKVVTAFTVAHSITLALAVLGVLAPPSRWVESVIAASVVLAALNNLWPLVPHRWGLTFVFGLVHGFGFAGAMQGLDLGGGSLVAPLLGFNLGVELGQIGIVAVFLPLAWLLRHGAFYRRAVLGGGSVAAALMAAVWLVERAFDISLLGGA